MTPAIRLSAGLEHAALTILGALMLFAPIPLGSKHPLGWGILTTLILVAATLWIASTVTASTTRSLNYPSRIASGLFFLFSAYIFAQALPLPASIVAFLNPGAHALYSAVEPGEPIAMALSTDRGVTLDEALRSSSLFFVFLMLVNLLNTKRRLIVFTYVVLACGIAHASFALLDAVYDGHLFRRPIIGLGSPSASIAGTYSNRNHFAGLMELTFFVAVALYLAQLRRSKPLRNTRERLRRVSNWLLSVQPWYLLSLLIALVALLFSASRGGFLSAAAASLLLGVFLAFRSRFQVSKANLLIVLAVVLPLFAATALGVDRLAKRLENRGLTDDRYELRQLGYRMASDFPFFGSGSGTFRHLYPAYENTPFGNGKLLHHVHNDYLELALETGLVGFALFSSAILLCLYWLVKAPFRITDRTIAAIRFGGLGGVLSLLIHSLVDWNLQIPANAYWFTVVLAIAMASTNIDHDRRISRR